MASLTQARSCPTSSDSEFRVCSMPTPARPPTVISVRGELQVEVFSTSGHWHSTENREAMADIPTCMEDKGKGTRFRLHGPDASARPLPRDSSQPRPGPGGPDRLCHSLLGPRRPAPLSLSPRLPAPATQHPMRPG